MSEPIHDVLIIGAGPGGYVCAIRCAQLGLKVAMIDKRPQLGGTCLNIGCIPSKALLHSTELYQQATHASSHGIKFDGLEIDVRQLMKRKDAVVAQLCKGVRTLVDARKIQVYTGTAQFTGPQEVSIANEDKSSVVTARQIVIATGSAPVALPFLKPDGQTIVTSEEALCFEEIPQSMVVIGGGAIGLEMGSVWARLGCDVTIVEFLPTIAAGSDEDVSKLAERIFKKQGLKVQTGTRVTACTIEDGKAVLTTEKAGKSATISADKVLLSVGRRPYTDGLALEAAGLSSDEKGRIPVDGLKTSVPHIWAIGDVVDGPMLAHKAEEDGVAVAEAIAANQAHAHVDYGRVPNVIYTHPEIASIGMTERVAKEKGIKYRVGKFPLQANGRAIAQDATDGMVKVIACESSDRILGAAIIAAGASEMIASLAAHMEYGGSAEDLGRTIHAHPTISECIKEAALAVDKAAIHGM